MPLKFILTCFSRDFTFKTQGSHQSAEISDALRIKFHHPHHLAPSLLLILLNQKKSPIKLYPPQQKPLCKPGSPKEHHLTHYFVLLRVTMGPGGKNLVNDKIGLLV